ncbi:MAG TPA: DUF1223 domain-containing protein [Roseiarcus sp.]|nr:DUF1223 domain-containing protein [Roseiarcus sp.]
MSARGAAFAAAVAMIIGPAPSYAAEAAGVHSVVELFTSQGCSSCPPADRILGELARDPSVLAVSYSIDYWDYIGWKDTLAQPTYTQRQEAYAKTIGRGQVYTPQAIVNGLADAIGSDRNQIEAAESATAKRAGVLSVPMSIAEQGDAINITVGAAPPGAPHSAGVYLLALASKRTVVIQRGENAGATITYSNVVRGITKVGEWSGAEMTLSANLAQARLDGADAYAVILQQGDHAAPSTILAAVKGP